MRARRLIQCCLVLSLVACAINPVTGRRELAIISQGNEIAIGQKAYAPARQQQGGDYTLDPGVVAYVQRVGQRLAAVSDRALPYEFSVINDGTPNAWAMPGGKIAVNRGLLTELGSEAELAAVLGHEVVHAAARHGALAMQRGLLLQALGVGAAIAGGGEAGLLAAQLGGALVMQKHGRDAEREADFYGMQYMSRAGYDPRAAVTLQETFVRLSEGRSSSWLQGLFASHPPSQERVAANRATLAQLPAGGEIGAERYREALARLFATKEAYQAHEQARKALGVRNYGEAEALLRRALQLEPREGLFHLTQGDLRAAQGRPREALAAYQTALDRDPGYYQPWLKRGLMRYELGQTDAAERDLTRSAEILPTPPAYYVLGRIHRARGETDKAKEFFAAAASSQSEVGKKALVELLELDLPVNPDQYLKLAVGRDASGATVAQVGNPTPLAVTNVEFALEFGASGARVVRSYRVPSAIAAGATAQVPLGLDPGLLEGLQGRITAAALAR